jgi:NhaP-type Na+/H+ and K+/H+ antiporter
MSFWEQIKEKTEAAPVKLKMIFLENTIESLFLRLGSRIYDAAKTSKILTENRGVQTLLAEIDAKKKELEKLREDFRKIWNEESRQLKATLEKGGGALEQIRLADSSPAKGKQVKDLALPPEVLLGPVTRGKDLIIPHGETELLEGDRVTLMGTRKDMEAAKKYLQGKG